MFVLFCSFACSSTSFHVHYHYCCSFILLFKFFITPLICTNYLSKVHQLLRVSMSSPSMLTLQSSSVLLATISFTSNQMHALMAILIHHFLHFSQFLCITYLPSFQSPQLYSIREEQHLHVGSGYSCTSPCRLSLASLRKIPLAASLFGYTLDWEQL